MASVLQPGQNFLIYKEYPSIPQELATNIQGFKRN